MGHDDIRIGTLVGMGDAVRVIPQILPHGFESVQLNCWKYIGEVDLKETAKKVKDLVGGKAVISSVGVFGNPLTDEKTAADFGRMIDHAKLFGADVVVGFAGGLPDKAVPETISRYAEVWGPLAKRAKDAGLRIAYENCDMGGTWKGTEWNIAHAPAAWELMFNAIPSENVGLCWEPCHQMVSLIDPVPQLREWVGKVFHVHGKDATVAWDVVKRYGIRGGRDYVWHRTPGFGDTNWADIISILRMNKFRGSIDIEGWHDPVYNNELEYTGQVHGLNYLKQCRGGAFVPNPK